MLSSIQPNCVFFQFHRLLSSCSILSHQCYVYISSFHVISVYHVITKPISNISNNSLSSAVHFFMSFRETRVDTMLSQCCQCSIRLFMLTLVQSCHLLFFGLLRLVYVRQLLTELTGSSPSSYVSFALYFLLTVNPLSVGCCVDCGTDVGVV